MDVTYRADGIVPPVRRPEFPSWSWIGWENEVHYHWDHDGWEVDDSAGVIQDPDTDVSFELTDGSIIPWGTFEEKLLEAPESHTWASRFVWIQALSMDLSNANPQPGDGPRQPGKRMGIVLGKFTRGYLGFGPEEVMLVVTERLLLGKGSRGINFQLGKSRKNAEKV